MIHWSEHTIPGGPRAHHPHPARSFPHHRADPRLWTASSGEKGSVFATPDPSRSSPLARNLRLLQIEAGPHNARVFNRPVISRLVQGSPTSTPVIPYAVSGVTPARARFTVPLLFRQRRWRGSSPLARGLQERGVPGGSAVRIIPARAGFTRGSRRGSHRSRDHPRSRGVYSATGGPRTAPAGSSPLARGLPPWDEYIDWDSRGSSPLARGLHDQREVTLEVTRIIPARAGFTAMSPWSSTTTPDHPRSRGVYPFPRHGTSITRGSSPLARGLRVAVEHHLRVVRIIPARAGFTTGSFGAPVLRDGSSPLARGLRYDLAKRLPKGRIIPARAGFTCHAEGRVHQ